jgi:hypothetical protein
MSAKKSQPHPKVSSGKITDFSENLSEYVVGNSAKFRGIVSNFARNTEETEVQKTYGIQCRRNSVDTLYRGSHSGTPSTMASGHLLFIPLEY